MKRVLFLLFIFLPVFLFGQCDLLPTSTTHEIVKHTYYTLSYSKKDEQAEWVAYLLTHSMLTHKSERGNNFRPDPAVPSGSAQLADYNKSGYDRGHLCPAGDMTFNAEAMSETFYLSNMSPQIPAFNRGIWKSLETLVRDWAAKEDSIYIVTGGILSDSKGSIGKDRVTVPKSYYKVIYDLTGEKKMIAFILPNAKSTKPLSAYVITVDFVESQTGLDFLSNVVITRMLQNISHEILHANTGVEAIECCHNNPDLDLVLMDMKTPIMDGYEATRQIRQFNKDIAIIAQTAYGFASDREKAIEVGCNDYISKPIKKTLLHEVIKNHFNK